MNAIAPSDRDSMTYLTRLVEPGVREVVMNGRISFSDLDGLQEILDLARLPGLRCLRLDLTAIAGIDSSAIGILLLIRDAIMARGTSLDVRSADDHLRQLLSISRGRRGQDEATGPKDVQ